MSNFIDNIISFLTSDNTIQFFTYVPVAALCGWLGKIWATRIASRETKKNQIEIERIKDQLLSRQNVFKIQFEKEFEIYIQLCRYNTEMRSNLGALVRRKYSTNEEEAHIRNNITKNANCFIELVNSYEAFMSEKVSQHAFSIIELLSQSDNGDIKEPNAFFSDLDKKTKELASVIRKRFRELNAVE